MSSSPEKLASESDVESECGVLSTDYRPSTESSDSTTEPERAPSASRAHRKYIVFEENLEELHRFCKDCGSSVTEKSQFTSGSSVRCHAGHSYTWRSQPYQHDQPLGNIMMAAAILVTGCTYAKISAFAGVLQLQFFSVPVS